MTTSLPIMSKIGAAKIRIDVTKIDKSAIYEGKKGKYIDLIINIDDEEDDYGQHGMTVQDIGKERKDAGERGPILGNVQKWWPADNPVRSSEPAPAPQHSGAATHEADDDIPF